MSTLARRFFHGVWLGAARQVITVASQIVLVPLFLSAWGKQLYGEWLSLTAALAYIGLLDGGIQLYAVNVLTGHFARREIDAYRRVVWAVLGTILVLAAAALACAAVAAVTVSLRGAFALSEMSEATADVVLVALAAQFAIGLPVRFLSGLYQSQMRYPARMLFDLAAALLVLGGLSAVLLFGAGPGAAALVQLSISVLIGVAMYRNLARGDSWLTPKESTVDLRLGLSFLRPGLFFLLIQLSAAFMVQGMVLVVSMAAGAAAVVVFSTQRTLANLIQQLAGIVNSTLWAEFSSLDAKADEDRLRWLERFALRGISAFVVLSWVYLHFCAGFVLKLWTLDRVAVDPWAMRFLALDAGVLAITNTATMRLVATNRHRRFSVLSFIGNTAAVCVAWYAASRWGIPGVAGAIFVCDVVFRLPMLAMSAGASGQSVVRSQLWPLARSGLVGIPVIGTASLIEYVVENRGWYYLGVQAAAIAGVGMASFILTLGADERRISKHLLLRFSNRFA